MDRIPRNMGPEIGRIVTFRMYRGGDESGVSGTGYVLYGAIFPNGETVVRWTVPRMPNSTAIYKTFRDFRRIHIDAHPSNNTIIEKIN